VYLSGRNVPHLTVLPYSDATAYDILRAEALVIEASALGADVALNSDDAVEAPVKKTKRAATKSATKTPKAAKPKATKAAAKPKSEAKAPKRSAKKGTD
jgi:hypothetical protein